MGDGWKEVVYNEWNQELGRLVCKEYGTGLSVWVRDADSYGAGPEQFRLYELQERRTFHNDRGKMGSETMGLIVYTVENTPYKHWDSRMWALYGRMKRRVDRGLAKYLDQAFVLWKEKLTLQRVYMQGFLSG
jgi:hypothetical protein